MTKKEETLFGAHLPTDFVGTVKKYADDTNKKNKKAGSIEKITHRTILFNSLSEYMKNHPV